MTDHVTLEELPSWTARLLGGKLTMSAVQRTELRVQVARVLHRYTNATEVETKLARSPFVTEGHINPRRTVPGLRGALSPKALVMLGLRPSRTVVEDIYNAIVDPATYGVTTRTSTSGYEFGTHKDWNLQSCLDMVTALIPVDDERVLVEEHVLAAEEDDAFDTTLIPGIDAMLNKAGVSTGIVDILRTVKLAKEQLEKPVTPVTPVAVTSTTSTPNGTLFHRTLDTVLPKSCVSLSKVFMDKLPQFEWDTPHPLVPLVEDHYILRPRECMVALRALLKGEQLYIHGHTGTGKTTLIEQLAAYMRWPVMRVNLDSEISRLDLIGRDTLVTDDTGNTVSRFVDGILPQALDQPCIMLLDEFDFVRPDVSYVLQRVLEGSGLTLLEDGGRYVPPHPMFRIVATGNTAGQGDEHGMYSGARQQSLACLDRFTSWLHVDYLDMTDMTRLMKANSRIPADLATGTLHYIRLHREAFIDRQVMQPMTPRTALSLGNALGDFGHYATITDNGERIKLALEATVLDRCTSEDKLVLQGLATRTFGDLNGKF